MYHCKHISTRCICDSRPDPAPLVLQMGTVHEWLVPSIYIHPLHLHSSPYQITLLPNWTEASGASIYTNFWEPGDW